MDEQSKRKIVSNLHYLAENTCDFPQLMIQLVTKGVLTLPETDDINAKLSSYEKHTALYFAVTKKGGPSFETLLDCLNKTGNTTLTQKLKEMNTDDIAEKLRKIKENEESGAIAISVLNIFSFFCPKHSINLQVVADILKIMSDHTVENLIFAFGSLCSEPKKLNIGENVMDVLQKFQMCELLPSSSNDPPHAVVTTLVQETIRRELVRNNSATEILERLVFIFSTCSLTNFPNDQLVHLRDVWKHASKFKILVEMYPDFPLKLATLYYSQQKYNEAFTFSSESVQALESVLGKQHLSTINLKFIKGSSAIQCGKISEAKITLLQVLESQKEFIGNEGKETLKTTNAIGLLLLKQGMHVEAISWFRKAFEASEKWYGKYDVDTLAFKYNIATSLRGLGRYDEALAIFEELVTSYERNDGKDHYNPISVKGDIGIVKFYQKQYKESDEILQNVINATEGIFKDDDPYFLNAKQYAGETLHMLGRSQDAKALLKQVYDKRKGTLGRNHPTTLVSKRVYDNVKKSLNSEK